MDAIAAAGALAPWITKLTRRSQLSAGALKALCQLPFELVWFESNRDIVCLGECSTSACVIVRGLAARFDQTASGARQITALHIPGDAADLHSVPVPRTANALQSLTRSQIARIPHVALRELVAESPEIAMAFWRDCVVDAAILSKWVLNIGRVSARVRLAHLICELSERYDAIGEDPDRFELAVTQTQLGDATGRTNVHVNRVLRELSEEQLVTILSGLVEIINRNRLIK